MYESSGNLDKNRQFFLDVPVILVVEHRLKILLPTLTLCLFTAALAVFFGAGGNTCV